MSLFEQYILQEAVPKKAKELGIAPEAPPDLTKPNAQPDAQEPQPQGPDQAAPQDQGAPADVDPNAGLDNPAADNPDPSVATGDPGADNPDTEIAAGGGEGDPNMEGDPNTEGDPNAADPNADPNAQDPNQLQGPDGVGGGDELQQADQELYAELKPEQRKIQTRELKERFQDLYKIVSESLDKLNKVNKTSFDANMLDVCMRNLIALKDMIYTSITASFSTRTYVENKVELEKLATMFNSINNMVGIIYEARLNRAAKYNNPDKAFDLNKIDFTQDLGF